MVTQKVIQELRNWLNTGDQQVIAGARAGDVKQMALGVVDLLQVGVVSDGLDACLAWDNLIVASHDDDRSELQALGIVHRTDGDGAVFDLHLVAELNRSGSSNFQRSPCPLEFGLGADKDTDLVWLAPFAQPLRDPRPDSIRLLAWILALLNQRRRPVEHRNGSAPPFGIAIDIGHRGRKQAIRMQADLVRGAIVDPKRERSPAHVEPECLPGKWLLENALTEIAGEEQPVRPGTGKDTEKPRFSDAEILAFIDNRMVEGPLLARSKFIGHAPENLATLRGLALMLLAREQTFKAGVARKQAKVSRNTEYRERILFGIFTEV